MTATQAKAASKKAKDTTRALKPSAVSDAVTVNIPEYGEVVQRPLSFFGKAEFLALVAEALDKAMVRGLSIGALLDGLDLGDENIAKLREGEVTDFATVERLTGLLTKLFASVPDLLADAYLIWLAIPEEDRGRCRKVMMTELDDDTGFQILETFVSQNGDTLADFFKRWWVQIQHMMNLQSS